MPRAWLVIVALSGALLAPTVRADPFTLILLKMLRDQAVSSSIEAGVNAPQQRPGLDGMFKARPLPQAQSTPESQELKSIIDESFLHLSPQQRAELHASLMGILNDPVNLPIRESILTEFKAQAQTLRDSHRVLSQLSESDMRGVAADARREFEKLPDDQRRQLLQALQQGVPGMPRTLQDMMLAEFRSVPAAR
jgi:rRNA-processing protein FCF1